MHSMGFQGSIWVVKIGDAFRRTVGESAFALSPALLTLARSDLSCSLKARCHQPPGFFVSSTLDFAPSFPGSTGGGGSAYGTKALAAELLALNQVGEGSSPSGPTPSALVVQRRGLRTRNAATWVRVPPGALRLIDNSASVTCAHVVVEAYRPATAEARVRLPLGT